MRNRIAVHLVALFALIGIGVWIGYQGLVAPTTLGPVAIDLDLAVMYWFALLIYGFVCLVLYYPLRTRPWWALLIGHASAAVIALASTMTVTALGHQRALAGVGAPPSSTEAAENLPDVADPSVLPLPLPPRKNSFPARIGQP